MLLFFNRLVLGDDALIQGEYVWYTYSPTDGYINDNGVRKVDDKGNASILGTSGLHDGTMFSGNSITVTSDGVIPVPINATLGSELIDHH